MKDWELQKKMKYRFQLKYKKQMLFEGEVLEVVKVQEANVVEVDGEILKVIRVKYF